MTTLNISLPESMRKFIDQQIDSGGYSTASEYIRHLIRIDQEKTEKKQIEKLLLEGLNNGEPIEITDDWWSQKRIELMERLNQSQ
ncbi:MAG: type II toxin-antitoxin system ParD family antitoxin [Xenococcaceae cyanobacterium MO_207.B15]|nr:type II toxin-antitoxin system ParD family antitoxin [Xenococcaceae cyanobacterium MO_207.B15]